MKRHHKLNQITKGRVHLMTKLEAAKKEHPELEEILNQFQIDQAEYDKTMMAIFASQTEPRNTYVTINGPFNV
jgi:hypothetical protein